MRRATVLTVILLATLVLAACGKDAPLSDTETTSTPTPATTPKTSTTPALAPRSARDGCKAVANPVAPQGPAPKRRLSRKRLSAKSTYIAVVETNCGTIRILLAVARSPKTTASFAGLVRAGFYDGLTFHRIAKPGGNDFVIQGGDPLLDGNGGPGYTVVEKPSKRTSYVRGVVAMAKTPNDPPGTSGSQFFVVTAEKAPLPPEYAVLGRVTGGDRVVRRIARLAVDPGTEMPLDPVVIKRIRLVRR